MTVTLYEMSFLYGEDALRLRLRITQLRHELRDAPTRREAEALRVRIENLVELLRQSRELAEHTRHYYERGYHRDEKYTL